MANIPAVSYWDGTEWVGLPGFRGEQGEGGKPAFVKTTETTLLASGWSGGSQTISVTGATADKTKTHIIFDVSMEATAEEIEAAISGIVRATAQGDGSLTVTAFGDAPTIDIPVSVMVTGVEG